MSRFICNLCNKEFTSKYGLQKHNNKKILCNVIPIKKAKPIFQCEICNKILSSRQNLDNHIFGHKLKKMQNNNLLNDDLLNDSPSNDNLLNEDLSNDNLLQDNLLNEELSNNSSSFNNLLQDNLLNDELSNKIYIKITIDEYNILKNENQKLKDELFRLNSIIGTINNIDNSVTNINDNSITNIDNSITNNIQINIIPFHETIIDFKYIYEVFKDKNSPLHDFSKIFNYDHLSYPKSNNGLNNTQKYKAEQVKKTVAKERKKYLPSVSLGFCNVLDKHFLEPKHKNLKLLTKNMIQSYNGCQWDLITSYETKRTLFKKIIESIEKYYNLNTSNNFAKNSDMGLTFIMNDFYKNFEEYYYYHNNVFINTIKKIK